MPYQATWLTWPVVWFKADRKFFMRSSNFKTSSLVNRAPFLEEGLCVGLCIRWLRRHFDRPDETPLARLSYLQEYFDSAAAVQFIHTEICGQHKRAEGNSENTMAEAYNAITRVSQLKFAYSFGVRQPQVAGSVARFVGSMKCGYHNFLNFEGNGVDLAFGPSICHAVALAYDSVGTMKFFDPEFGEFEVGPHQLGRFLTEYYQFYEEDGVDFEYLTVYEVTKEDGFSALNEHLTRIKQSA